MLKEMFGKKQPTQAETEASTSSAPPAAAASTPPATAPVAAVEPPQPTSATPAQTAEPSKEKPVEPADMEQLRADAAKLLKATEEPAPKRKFYHALNSNRRITGRHMQFTFGAYQHVGGTWMGVYATDNAEEQAILDELVAKKSQAVTALTAEEYDDCLKKKVESFHLSGQSLIRLDGQQSSQQSARLAEPLNSEPAPPAPPAPPVESAADALTVGAVSPPPAA